MAKTWFPHEEGLAEGEVSTPILGPRWSPFWIVGSVIGFGFLFMAMYLSCSFIFSRPPQQKQQVLSAPPQTQPQVR